MNTPPTDRDIETAGYSHWHEIVGNYRLKEYCRAMVERVAGPEKGRGINTLVVGPSRTGKTSTTEFAIKGMLCRNLVRNAWEPCGKCELCCQNAGRSHHVELEVLRWGSDDRDLQFLPLDGNSATAEDINRALSWSQGQTGRWLYHIDEIQGLVRRHLDQMLYKVVEQRRYITWIVTTATLKGLDPMFVNRFTQVPTELPITREHALSIARDCKRYGITWDDDETILRLVDRSGRIVGKAKKVLAQAKMGDGVLTRQMVDEYVF